MRRASGRPSIDGREAEKGGAASKLTNPATRTIYSNLTTESGVLSEELSELKDSSNLLLANTLLLDGRLVDGGRRPSDT